MFMNTDFLIVLVTMFYLVMVTIVWCTERPERRFVDRVVRSTLIPIGLALSSSLVIAGIGFAVTTFSVLLLA